MAGPGDDLRRLDDGAVFTDRSDAVMARLHPVYGYDMDKVSKVLCLICDQPIGDEEYTEITNLARFGQMLFCHKRCEAR